MTARLRPDVLARYGSRNIPRYTSYPTAPHFRPAPDDKLVRQWLAGVPTNRPVSLYVHIPFCRSMCWYCGCHTTVTRRDAPVERYLATLAREIAMVTEALPGRIRVSHLHFGGGTPTLMAPEQFRALMEQLRSAFDFLPDAEVAIEIDPRTLEPEMVEALADSGVNRASLGVQSFDPVVQRAINRVQSFAETKLAVERLRGAEIEAINFDLIYGLPHQTVESCVETVAQAVALKPNRLAVFGYAHVPSFKLHQRKIDSEALPDGEQRLAQAQAIAGALVGAGYAAIGLDHFAAPGDSLAVAAAEGGLHRNFQGYTTDACETLIGFGASAIGRLPAGFVQNAVLIPDYQKRIAEGRLASTKQCPVSADDRRRAAVIERIMCDYRVDLAGAAELADEARLEPLVRDGLIRRHGEVIEVLPEARPLVRAVAAAFDAYLDEGAGRHARAV
ncbi:oxygen-independent coproporphyrinogen III oxidase [Sphingomonas arenae]|uniref:oxygen-independent coproporphyrinogen III oxidase n=1 Tax=Sphingomonas arenae TaxID=2812555 RepID=UPI0019673FAB|nr:oxygen-independent coproporphyrinogen III oxidase [Sphingomonas arenae]